MCYSTPVVARKPLRLVEVICRGACPEVSQSCQSDRSCSLVRRGIAEASRACCRAVAEASQRNRKGVAEANQSTSLVMAIYDKLSPKARAAAMIGE